jgi:DNA-directed RNA polymerase subunit RPC12/RpoP
MTQSHDFRCPSCGGVVSITNSAESGNPDPTDCESAQCTLCGRQFSQPEIDHLLEALGR